MDKLAQGIKNPALGDNLNNMLASDQSGAGFFGSLLSTAFTAFLIIGVLLFVFYLLYGGLSWIMSGGDKSAIESARSKILQAIAGIIILFSVWAFVILVETIFGVSILSIDLSGLVISS